MSPLAKHFDENGVDGSAPCPMFAVEFRVHSGGVELAQTYPCHSADGDYFALAAGRKACHGDHTDCRSPAHRKWLSLYDANRRAAQAEGFVRHLKGTPASAVAARELTRQPWAAAYGRKSAAV